MAKNTNIKVPLRNVRGSFLYLFEPRQPKPEPGQAPKKPKYEANFLLHKVKNAKDIRLIQETMQKLATEQKWPDPLKPSKFFKSLCLCEASEKLASDGSALEGYDADHMVLTVRGIRKPTVFNPKDGSPMASDPSEIYYSGAFLHANVELYAHFNPSKAEHGKHICASPVSVIFSGPGERFGGSSAPKDFSEEFGDVGLPEGGDNSDESLV